MCRSPCCWAQWFLQPLRAVSTPFFHEDVLGTSFELKVNAATPSTAEFAESVALRETDRLNLVFSNFEPESEFSRFVAAAVGELVPVSAELADALARSEKWTAASGGAFNPAAELFTQLWSRAAEDGVVPDRAELAAAVERVRGPHWELDAASGRAKRASDVPLTLNAITKGDRARPGWSRRCCGVRTR